MQYLVPCEERQGKSRRTKFSVPNVFWRKLQYHHQEMAMSYFNYGQKLSTPTPTFHECPTLLQCQYYILSL